MLVCEVLLLLFVCNRYLPPYQTISDDIANAGSSVFSVSSNRKARMNSSSDSNKAYTIMMDTVLMVYRIIAWLWFLVVAWIINWSRSKDIGAIPYNYFTHWNVIGLSIYFMAASLCSINYHCFREISEQYWYYSYRTGVAKFLQRAFDVLGMRSLSHIDIATIPAMMMMMMMLTHFLLPALSTHTPPLLLHYSSLYLIIRRYCLLYHFSGIYSLEP